MANIMMIIRILVQRGMRLIAPFCAAVFLLLCVVCVSSQTKKAASSSAPANNAAADHREDEKLKLAWEQFNHEQQISNERLALDKQRAEIDNRFFNKHIGTLITGLISLAAIVVSLSQVIVAHVSKKKELEVATINKNAELAAVSLNHQRDWNLKAVEFVAENQELIFSGDRKTRERITNVMLATFPPEITSALFQKLEAAVNTPEEKKIWQAGREAATKQLLVRVDGMYAAVDRKNKYTQFLRFYPDGTVVSSSVSGVKLDPVPIAQWLKPDSTDLPQGSIDLAESPDPSSFLIQGSEVKFSLTSPYGVVDYHGTVKGNSLALNMHSHINGNRSSRMFHFVSIVPNEKEIT